MSKGEPEMKHINIFMITIMAFLTLSVAADISSAEEAAVLTKGAKVLLENDRVKVTEANRHPGETETMHTHGAYVAYFFSPCKIKFTFPDGKITEKEFTAGQVMWTNGITHAIEVIGNNDQHVLVIELKK